MNDLQNARDYLRKALAELADSDASPEEMKLKIDRAKATSNVTDAIVQTLKIEIDAVRVADEFGLMPASLKPVLRIDGKPAPAVHPKAIGGPHHD